MPWSLATFVCCLLIGEVFVFANTHHWVLFATYIGLSAVSFHAAQRAWERKHPDEKR